MPAASGRDVIRLAEISRQSGVNVVACTGLHTSKYYEGQRWTVEESAEVLAGLFIADVVQGLIGTTTWARWSAAPRTERAF